MVDSVKINGTETGAAFGQQKQISIPAKGNYEIFPRIKNVLKPDWVKPYSAEEMMQIPIEKYRLLAILALVQGTRTDMRGLNLVIIDYK
jgi:hypothetical protein